MQTVAENNARHRPGEFAHVANFQNGQTRSFYIQRGGEFAGESFILYDITSPNWLTNKATEIKTLLAEIPQVSNICDFRSAEDFLNHANPNAFDDCYNKNHIVKYWALQFTSAVGGFFLNVLSGIEITFQFDNGSTATFKAIDPQSGDNTIRLKYVPGSARDADGNIISENTEQYLNKNFEFNSEQTIQDFVFRAQGFGFDVSSINTPGGGSITTTIRCTRNPDQSLSCSVTGTRNSER